MSIEHKYLVNMLKESITLMCKSSLSFEVQLNIEGLLGITLDHKDVVLVNINESFKTPNAPVTPPPTSPSAGQKRSKRDIIEIKGEDDGDELPSRARTREVRWRSRESQGISKLV